MPRAKRSVLSEDVFAFSRAVRTAIALGGSGTSIPSRRRPSDGSKRNGAADRHPAQPMYAILELVPGTNSEWRPPLIAGMAVATITVGIAVVFALFGHRPPEARPTMRFSIALPEDLSLDPLRSSIALSADGTRLVYAAVEHGRSRLFLRTVDCDRPTLIQGSDDAVDPLLSPDREWVGFFAHGSLKKLRTAGGRAAVLCAARAGAGASWGSDGTIVFGGGPGFGLARVSADGGEAVVLAAPMAGSREVRYGWPELLPDGRSVLYTAVTLADSAVALLDFASGERRVLVEAAAFGRLSPTGHLIVERRGRLEAAPFSLDERAITAPPQAVVRGVATDGPMEGPRFAFSRTGSLVYVPSRTESVDDRLHWLDLSGLVEPVPLPPVPLASVDVAPDLRRLALTLEGDAGADLWVGDLTRGALSRLIRLPT